MVIEFELPMAVTKLSVLFDRVLYGSRYIHDFVASVLYVMYVSVFKASKHIHYYIPIIVAFYSTIRTCLYLPLNRCYGHVALDGHHAVSFFGANQYHSNNCVCSWFFFLCALFMFCGRRTSYKTYTDSYGSTNLV